MSSLPIIDLVQSFYPEASRTSIKEWIKLGRVSVKGEIVTEFSRLFDSGERVFLLPFRKEKCVSGVKIIYEDRSFVAINKPPQMLSVPTENLSYSALFLLRQHYQTSGIFPVHRIDRDTSGLMIFAKGIRARESFSALFENHDILRYYVAILEGKLKKKVNCFESHLKELESHRVIVTSPKTEGAKKAITHVRVLKESKKFSYVLAKLETGRKHQIRVHCADAGCPVAGDSVYGSGAASSKKMLLHALSLSFIHPFRKIPINLRVPIPRYFTYLGFPDPSQYLDSL
ncbi:RluA family pseudouridine synthase [Chlamydiifrater volucris]|uniref:RluA family pseudouridine synthase n=1 Tax=Chlamydiifrater volucris TaxID=2681470 RepID=UPI001BD0015F|nr:RluA family pseudouridine synthase [Chlamydiifrater volucris]